MKELLLLALVLACPLMMVFMMRGHRHHGARAEEAQEPRAARGHEEASAHELRRRRDELDAVIAERERANDGAPAPGARS